MAPTILFSPSDQERLSDALGRLRAAALKQCLPLGLVLAIIIGLTAPVLGQAAASARVGGFGVVDTLCVWFIFFVSGLTLKTEDAVKALTAWKALFWSLFSILGATPLVAPLASRIPPPFPREFALGFAIFCSMPTTINTGVALTVQAKGSFALALVITVSTNLLAVFTVPFYLSAVLQFAEVHIDPVRLLVKLLVLILTPLLLGKGTRELSAGARSFAAAHKARLSYCSNGALILIPWMKLSESSESLRSAGGLSLLLVLLLALAIHALYLVFNLGGCKALRLPDEHLRAVVIMGSQKTLPMALAVLAAMPPEFGAPGLIAVPCIVAHISQIFVDAFIATRWSNLPLRLQGAEPGASSSRLADHAEAGGVHDVVEMARPLAEQQPRASHGDDGADDRQGDAAGENGRSEHAIASESLAAAHAEPEPPIGRPANAKQRQVLLLDVAKTERSDDVTLGSDSA